jgi:eukaryotic-like serine/threonine-protein kinase
VEPRDPLIGSILDRRFRIDERIAAGGFGIIYRATHVKSKYPVAIKVLHPAMSSDDRVKRRFRREGETLTALRNPHTVTTYELATDPDGRMFMVMELLRGETLLQRFKREGTLPWRRVVAIARAVCESLAEAHGMGIVHRDLKPENIHLGDDDFVKVLDFGIAKLLRKNNHIADGGEDLTKHNEVIGTFDYVSPEQIVGDEYSGRSDIYTLAVVMYEMMTGTRPFGHATGPALLATILTTPPSPPSQRMPGIPPALDQVLLACLEHDANKRFPDVHTLAAALDAVHESGDESATRHLVLPTSAHEEETRVGHIPTRPPSLGPPFRAPDAPPYATPLPPSFLDHDQGLEGATVPHRPTFDETPAPTPIPRPPYARDGSEPPFAGRGSEPPQPVPYRPSIASEPNMPAQRRSSPTPPPPFGAGPAQRPSYAPFAPGAMPPPAGMQPYAPTPPPGGVPPVMTTLDGWAAPQVPSTRAPSRPSFDVANDLARERWIRSALWVAVLILAIIAGIVLAVTLR